MSDFHNELVDALPQLRAFAISLTRDRTRADDLVQDAVARALTASEQFKPGTNLKAWVFTILRNQYISNVRKHKVQRAYAEDRMHESFVTPPEQENDVVMAELEKALATLPEKQREVFVLISLNGFTYEQAAEVCGCALGTIRSRLARARRELRLALLGEEQAPSASQEEAPRRVRRRRVAPGADVRSAQ